MDFNTVRILLLFGPLSHMRSSVTAELKFKFRKAFRRMLSILGY